MLRNGRECKSKTAKLHGDIHIKGAKVPGKESSRERKFHGLGAKGPRNESSREREGQGAKGPGNELARVLLADSLRGANWPGSEKAMNRSTRGSKNRWDLRPIVVHQA